MTDWPLIFAYAVHLLATAAWVSGLAATIWVAIPAARRTLSSLQDQQAFAHLLQRIQQAGWFSLVLLTATGLFQMASHPAYAGTLVINSRWGLAMLLKHILFLCLLGVNAAITWGVLPGLRRLTWLTPDADQSGALNAALKRQQTLLTISLVFTLVILVFTAVARAS